MILPRVHYKSSFQNQDNRFPNDISPATAQLFSCWDPLLQPGFHLDRSQILHPHPKTCDLFEQKQSEILFCGIHRIPFKGVHLHFALPGPDGEAIRTIWRPINGSPFVSVGATNLYLLSILPRRGMVPVLTLA